MDITIIIPSKNEAKSLRVLLPQLQQLLLLAKIIVVDDGSSDETVEICKGVGVTVISHPYSKGNGAAIKTGVRAAESEYVICMDADSQHRVEDIQSLVVKMKGGFDMVVGARDSGSQASVARSFANHFYNRFSSWVTGQKIEDLTSGFRMVNRLKFLEFLHLLPNGFSYPTTITMAFFRAGYSVGYVPIQTNKRIGKSHIQISKDGIRFLLIIFKVGTLFSPMRIFGPVSVALFLLATSYYGYTYYQVSRFTNMSALIYMSSVIIFMMGLVSEQVTTLLYSKTSR